MNLFDLLKNYKLNQTFKPLIKIFKKKKEVKTIMKLERIYLKETYTIGRLFIDDIFFCDTLEDTYRDLAKEQKIAGKTAIPCGVYKVILSSSNKFKKVLPELLNVPNFTGIRIHNGNSIEDTEGCILVGKNKVKGGLIESKNALDNLMDKLEVRENLSINVCLK